MSSSEQYAKAWEGLKRYQQDPVRFWVEVLGYPQEYLWDGPLKMAKSVRDNRRTVVKAGNGVSKSHSLARIALWFLYCHPPATVLTTATTETQLKNGIWREIREAHAKSKVLFGQVDTLQIDLQKETGRKWFALGVTAKPDTVTAEATSLQGYHNDNMLVIFEEAAGILPEIWNAAERIGGNRLTRFIAVGNPTSSTGEFVRCFKDPDYAKLTISVKDTPNYKENSNRIPGVYGRDFEQRIITRYGIDSDEYRVCVLGEISQKSAPGAYYANALAWMREHDRIRKVEHDPRYPVFTVWDPGFTTAIWFIQPSASGLWHILRYYEAFGVDMGQWGQILSKFHEECGYRYGQHFAPADAGFANQYKLIDSSGLLDVARRAGINFTVLELEKNVEAGIERTREFLRSCVIDDSDRCELGLDRLAGYQQKVNRSMSSDQRTVFLAGPEKNGCEHGADAMRYASKATALIDPTQYLDQYGDQQREHRRRGPIRTPWSCC